MNGDISTRATEKCKLVLVWDLGFCIGLEQPSEIRVIVDDVVMLSFKRNSGRSLSHELEVFLMAIDACSYMNMKHET